MTTTPCTECGVRMRSGRGSANPTEARCRNCRHSYRSGCRCDECRAGVADYMRHYNEAKRKAGSS